MHPESQRDIITAFISKLLLVTVHMTGLIKNLMLFYKVQALIIVVFITNSDKPT